MALFSAVLIDHSLSLYLGSLFLLTGTTLFCLNVGRLAGPQRLALSMLSIFLLITYPIKALLTVYMPETAGIATKVVLLGTIKTDIIRYLGDVMPGLIAMLLAFRFTPALPTRTRTVTERSKKSSDLLLIYAIMLLLIMRLFGQIWLNIGLPGVTPKQLPIPYLTGIIDLTTRSVLFALINIYLMYKLFEGKERKVFLAFVFCLINIALGLRTGYKTELVFQTALIGIYFLQTHQSLSYKLKTRLATFAATLCLSMLIIYPLVNTYRQQLISGQSTSQSFAKVADTLGDDQSNFFTNFLSRLNGVTEYYLAVKLAQPEKVSISALFNTDIMNSIKTALYGNDAKYATTAFGTTQFSAFKIIGGTPGLILGGLIMGALMRLTIEFNAKYLFKYAATVAAMTPIFSLFWLRLISSGGALELFAKEFFLLITCCYLIEGYCYTRPTKRKRTNSTNQSHTDKQICN